MVSFRGSVLNLHPLKRILLWVFVLIIPSIALAATAGAAPLFNWWPFLLIPDLVMIIIALSLSGTLLIGHEIEFLDGEISYRKGWSRGRVPFRNLLRAYLVSEPRKGSILLIFNEPSSKNHPHRCLSIEEVFHPRDRRLMMKELSNISERTELKIYPSASMKEVLSDRRTLNWVPV